jgi:histidinol-phosphate aminotransferase
MHAYVRRGRRLVAKIVARGRHLTQQLTRPSDVELLMAALPTVDTAGALAGKVVVVTGSTRGIGRVVAREFAALGARVVINGRHGGEVDAAVAEITAKGGDAAGVAADASSEAGARRILEAAIAAHGGIDVLINNAAVGRGLGKKAWEALPEEIAETITADLIGPYLCAREAIRWMLDAGRPGRIINVSSLAADDALPGLTPYGIAKMGLEGLTRYLAVDLGLCGITVTTVSLHGLKTEAKAKQSWSEAELLPPAESVVPAFLHAATADARSLHGQSVAAWRFQHDPFAEGMLRGPLATTRALSYPPYSHRGEPVEREIGRFTFLDRAENPFGASPRVSEAVAAALSAPGAAYYPDQDYDRLRSALAREHDLPPECFVVGNGSWELIHRMLPLLLKPGEEVLTSDPGWFGFHGLLPRYGIANRRVPVDFGAGERRPHHDLQGFVDRIGVKTRMIYLISPANPEGIPLWADEFEPFLEQVPPHVPVVVDEAYAEYADHPDALQAPPLVQRSDRTVIALRTFSKFYALAGLRVGYAIARPDVAELLVRAREMFNVTSLSEAAALAALQDAEHRARVREQLCRARSEVEHRLAQLGLAFVPSQGPCILVECPCDLERYYERFQDEGIYLPRFTKLFADRYVLFPVARPEQNERNLELLRGLV